MKDFFKTFEFLPAVSVVHVYVFWYYLVNRDDCDSLARISFNVGGMFAQTRPVTAKAGKTET
jgi:hypothetical protein